MKFKRAGAGAKILILVLLAAAVAALLSVKTRLDSAEASREALTQQVQAQQEANAALADEIAHSDDPEYLESIARDKLGLLEPDEIVFADPSK